jgi:hypothetical protein
MRYTELKTWEDFAKALSQNPDPRTLTYLIEGLNRALGPDEASIRPHISPDTLRT